MSRLRIFLLIVAMLFSAACSAHPTIPTSSAPTPTAAALSVVSRSLQPVDTPTTPAACSLPENTRTRHVAVADVNYAERVIVVQQRIAYVNTTDVALSQILLHVEPNRWQNVFTLESIADDLSYTLDSKQLTVDLAAPLLPNCTANLTLDYRIDVPLIGVGITASKGYFGYTNRQMNLGHWLATIAPRQGEEWLSRTSFFIGEQEVLDEADWYVTLNMIGQNVTIAAPGDLTEINETSYRYVHLASRDFPASLSDQYEVYSSELENGLSAVVYSFPAENDAAQHALSTAERSFAMYNDLFGPSPYQRVIIVQGDFPDGMEFSGLVYVGNHWFTQYTGSAASYLTLITVHEVAHQWWYALVGNDPAMTPWLDEALATYSEYVFLEEYYPELKDWWWGFRVDAFGPMGYVDSTIYEFNTAREYINAVYLRGVRMLHDLRNDLGTEAFFQLLYDYAQAGAGRIATPEVFWSLLTPEQLQLTQQTRARYLRQPEVLGE